MFAMDQEFFQFIKKLEENGDKLTSTTPIEQPLDFEYNNSTCSVCNGYYGPSFGEPVCVTCHAFLFPDFPSYLPTSFFCSEKTDDGDSGNDEPSDLNFSSERKVNRCPLPAWWYYRSSLDSETSPEDEASRASNSGAGASSTGNGGSGSNSVGAVSLASSTAGSSLNVGAVSAGIGGVTACGRSISSGTGNGSLANALSGCSRNVSVNSAPGNVSAESGRNVSSASASGGTNGSSNRTPVPVIISASTGNGQLNNRTNVNLGSNASSSGVGSTAPIAARSDFSIEEHAGLGPPSPSPSLARSLQALSTPRPPDNLAPGLVEQLPSEVLLCIFSYLDDLSLCACACVCARWWRLVRARVAPPRWAAFTARRFPLYRSLLANIDWHKKYQSLVESCFCRNCLVQMCVQAQPAGDENAWRRNRLRIEVKMLRNDPPEGIAATPLDPKCCHWQASVTGPVGSPYEGGIFYLYIQVPYGYPMSPPVVRFLTRILHPNISRHGDVGIDSVHHNWSLALTISKVLISIQSLLTDPYTAVCMEPELGDMYVRDRQRFEALARSWTWRYAMHDIMPH